jgi:hypothetical protein
MALPDYLIERVRRAPPADSSVVPGSTPVVAFGNARAAAVATLGLNPSRVEFLDRAGNELPEPRRRLETLRSLALTGLQVLARHGQSPEQVEAILREIRSSTGS